MIPPLEQRKAALGPLEDDGTFWLQPTSADISQTQAGL
jgi:hypothetical protein